MTDAVITYTDEDTGTEFHWHGGAYIDVGYYRTATFDRFEAVDVINVWDDEQDRSYLEDVSPTSRRPFRRVLELFEARCREYLAESLADSEA